MIKYVILLLFLKLIPIRWRRSIQFHGHTNGLRGVPGYKSYWRDHHQDYACRKPFADQDLEIPFPSTLEQITPHFATFRIIGSPYDIALPTQGVRRSLRTISQQLDWSLCSGGCFWRSTSEHYLPLKQRLWGFDTKSHSPLTYRG